MRKVLETNLCKINYSESLEDLAQATLSLLEKKIIEYNTFFDISIQEKIIVNYFDTVEEFRECIYEIRGESNSLPEYARGTYDDGMVNACVNPKFQLKRLYTASHELFHIFQDEDVFHNLIFFAIKLSLVLNNNSFFFIFSSFSNFAHISLIFFL